MSEARVNRGAEVQNLWDWLIVGSLTLAVGGTASFAIPGGASGALLGSTTGAVLGAAIATKRQDEKQRNCSIRLQELEKQVAQQQDWANLNAQLPILRARVAQLQKMQTELATVEGQLIQKQSELQQVQARLTNLNEENEGLKRQILVINEEQPNLDKLEKLQTEIEQFRLNKSGLEGQISALTSQIESLETQKRSLVGVEAELLTKNETLNSLNQQVQQLQTRT